MPRQALDTSHALARFLRRRRKELGLSLRAVQHRAAEAGRPIPFSTLARIEQGKVDPGIKRLHTLLKLYHLNMDKAGDLLDLEELSEEIPTGDAATLYRQGLEHWKKGDTRKGMAYLLALGEKVPEEPGAELLRQKALLSMAIAAGSLGKRRLSLDIVQQLLLAPPDPSLLVNVLVQAGVTWNGLGSPEAAIAFLDRASTHVGADDHQQRAWICSERARALVLQGRYGAAGEVLDEALSGFRRAGDAYGEGKALGARVVLLERAGDVEGALAEAREGKAHAERHGFDRIRAFRLLDEGRLLVSLGDSTAGLRTLNEGLGCAMSSDDRRALFYAHYHLWKAHRRLGNRERSEVELNSARYFARFVDEASDEAVEVRRGMTGPEEDS